MGAKVGRLRVYNYRSNRYDWAHEWKHNTLNYNLKIGQKTKHFNKNSRLQANRLGQLGKQTTIMFLMYPTNNKVFI